MKHSGAGKHGFPENRSQETERILAEHGIAWTYEPRILIADIERHQEGQSRLRQVNRDQVDSYAEKMSRGAVFPAIVATKRTRDDETAVYWVTDGNTRLEAKKINRASFIDAYVITVADDKEAIYVSSIFNAGNGIPLDREELKQAVISASQMTYPPTKEQLAKDYGITVKKITDILATHQNEQDMAKLGFDIGELGTSALNRIASLKDATVKTAVAQLCIDSALPQAELETLLKNIKSKESEQDRLKVIADARADQYERIVAKQTGRVPAPSPLGRAAMVYGNLLSLIATNPDPEQWVPTNAERRSEYLPKVTDCVDFLNRVMLAYEKFDGLDS